MELSIRPAAVKDTAAILSLIRRELGYADLDPARFAQRMTALLSDPQKVTLVAVQGGDVIGFLGLAADISYEIEGRFLRLTALAVREDRQGHGVGRRLVEAAEALARERGIVALWLHSNRRRTGAHAFYERLGFVKSHYAFQKTL